MTQESTIQILWNAIEKRDRAVIEEDANIRKSYDMGNTNVDAYRHKLRLLRAELCALHEVATAILGYPSRMTVVDAYYGLPWDYDEFRYQGRVVTGIEECRDPGYFILYLEVSDACKVTGNTWLNRKPIPPQIAPAVKLTRRQRIILEGLTRNAFIFYPNLTNTLKNAANALASRKLITHDGNHLSITDAGRKALEEAQS